MKFSADRVKLPAAGHALKKPRDVSQAEAYAAWLLSRRCSVVMAMLLEMESISMLRMIAHGERIVG